MKIPDWADQALNAHRPLPATFPSDGQPDPVALARWTAYSERFRHRWHELEADKWKVPQGTAGKRASYNILTAALDCAIRIGKGAHPSKVVQARRDLLALDEEISELASQLASKFRLRDGIEADTGVASWRELSLDPIDLWDAFEMTFNPHPSSGRERPRANLWPGLEKSLMVARNTQLSIPEWPDLLEVLGDRFEHGTMSGDFPDITTAGHETNKTEYSPWCNALIRMLHEWQLIDYLSLAQLANLASVAFDSPPGTINSKQIGELKRNQLKVL